MAQQNTTPTTPQTNLKPLPVPPLRQSLDRYLAAVAPLLSMEQHLVATEAVASFEAAEGPACQASLLQFADEESAAGRSWLSGAWLSGYFSNRAPLPLSSNVGLRLKPSSQSFGIARAADAIHRLACVHLAYLRGEIPDEISPRGNALDMRQWHVLEGGLRHPHPGEDFFRDARPGAHDREVGVLWQGRMLMMRISDAVGQPFSTTVLAATLKQLATMHLADDDTFTHLSYLGSDKAAAHLAVLLENPANMANYERLTDAVFVVNLSETPASDEGHQERVTFQPGQAWTYKPFTYQVSLVDDFLGVHMEHGVVDGVTLRSIVEVMQKTDADDAQDNGAPVQLQQLSWLVPAELRAVIASDVEAYQRLADAYRVRILACPIVVPTDGRLTISHDAIQQFSLLYAQLSTYGRVRSTYEAVDMREFQAGRTECLRPVTREAVTLARALLDGTASPSHLHAALAAHKANVIACKTGQGFSRHLFGLQVMAERLGLDPQLFRDESFRALTTDFLSTTSVGDARQLMRFTFAPTSAGGIGVNYTVADAAYEFCLIHDAGQSGPIDDFVDGIRAGVAALAELLAEAQAG